MFLALGPRRLTFMLIGLDAIPLTEPRTGIGHYTFELASALARIAPAEEFGLLYPSTYPRIELSPDDDSAALPPNLSLTRVEAGLLGRQWWALGLPRFCARAHVKLFHGTNYEVPLRGRSVRVVSVHDLSLLVRPETHEPRRVRRARLRLPLMARMADAVIAPTESVRREVSEVLSVPPAKLYTVPDAPRDCFYPQPAAESGEVLRRLGIEGDFLLAVGTIEPRKNLSTLLRAFEDVVRERPAGSLKLVIVGRRGWMNDALFTRLESSGVSERVLFTGYLPDSDLRALYSSCRVFVFPSVYEGFGLPPLEAMRCGAPVVASRIPPLMETVEGAARLCGPDDPYEFARVIIELLDSESARRELAGRGLRRAAEFSWETTARRTLDVYEEALARARQRAN